MGYMDKARDKTGEWNFNLCWKVEFFFFIFTKSFSEALSLLVCSFFLSDEMETTELEMLDVCDISTTDIGERLDLQEHIQSTSFWEHLEHLGDFLPKPLSAICLTLWQKQLEKELFPLFEEEKQTKKDKVSRWQNL